MLVTSLESVGDKTKESFMQGTSLNSWVLFEGGIFSARSGPSSTKYLLNILTISCLSEVVVLFILNIGESFLFMSLFSNLFINFQVWRASAALVWNWFSYYLFSSCLKVCFRIFLYLTYLFLAMTVPVFLYIFNSLDFFLHDLIRLSVNQGNRDLFWLLLIVLLLWRRRKARSKLSLNFLRNIL